MKRIDSSIGSDGFSMRAKVFKELEEAILSGALSPGESLTEIRLSQELGVSRTPVREALRQLELEGLVKSIPNKGSVVVGITVKDIEDIYTIRMSMEGLAARWAAEHVTEEELAQMRDMVELQEFYAQKGEYMQVWQLDSRFHDLIHEASRSNTLRHTLDGFHHYIQRARRMAFESAARGKLSVQEHRELLEAIAAHDAERAQEAATLHIRNARDNFMTNIRGVI